MATGTAGSQARHYSTCQIAYLRKNIVFGNTGTTVVVGTIPAGALIVKAISGVYVTTAFNGDATNTLDIGASTDSGTNNFATLLALGTVTFVPLDEAVSNLVTVETIISAAVVSTATATTGAAEIVIAFIEDNDL